MYPNPLTCARAYLRALSKGLRGVVCHHAHPTLDACAAAGTCHAKAVCSWWKYFDVWQALMWATVIGWTIVACIFAAIALGFYPLVPAL